MAWLALLHIATRSAVWHFCNIPWSRTRLSQRVMYHWTSSVGNSISNERNVQTNMSRSMSKTRLESQCMKSYISKARTTGVYCRICLLSMLYPTASSLRSHLVSWTLLELWHHVEIDTWIWNRRGSEEGTSLLKTYSPKAKGRPSNHHLSSTLLAMLAGF